MLLLISATMAGSAAARPFVEPREMAPPGVLIPESYAQERWQLSTAPVRLLSSRVGRGKTWALISSEYVKAMALPGLRSALTRLERASMETTTLEEFREFIMYHAPGLWEKGWRESDSVLEFPRIQCDLCGRVHQSKIHVFGWKDPGRQLSAQFGSIAVDQAEQLDRRHYTIAKTRLRQNNPCINQRAAALEPPMNPRQMSLAVNPDGPEHWIAKMFDPDAGMRIVHDDKGRPLCDVILSSFNDCAQYLPEDYNDDLETLKGSVDYERLVLGKWARAEGLVYTMFDRKQVVVAKPELWAEWGGYPPPDWPRYRGVDFGWTSPTVFLWVATDPATNVDYVYREWSRSQVLVEDHAKKVTGLELEELKALREARALSGDPAQAHSLAPYLDQLYIRGSFADHDREDAATLARHGVRTTLAQKDKASGRRAIIAALNRGTLKIVAGNLVDGENPLELRANKPTSLAAELAALPWEKQPEHARNPSDEKGEREVDANDHRIDALRYILYSRAVTPRPSAWVAA